MHFTTFVLAAVAGIPLSEAALLWDGRFNNFTSAADLNQWSWANQVGPYQYYIHGNGTVEEYLELSTEFKNPADTASKLGAKFTLDSTAYWSGQNMRRTEIIPQTTAAINAGKTFYHFSMMRTANNTPSDFRLHKLAFFEEGFSEMNSGWIDGDNGTSNSNLQWMREHESQWQTEWVVDEWQNFAYEIDFDLKTVGLWHSCGGDNLTLAVAPASANSTASGGQSWHVGVLELARDGYADTVEDVYFSGVYIESDTLTTTVSGPASVE